MTVSLDVFVPMEPDHGLGPNARLHWRAKASLVADTRAAAKYATVNALHQSGVLFPKEYPIQIEAVIHWKKGRKMMDPDNASAILKSYLDGIADAVEVDDSLFQLQPVEQVGKAPVPGVVFFLSSLQPVRKDDVG